jgi:tRNA(Ile)-lysidine synthase TilS/MesJ
MHVNHGLSSDAKKYEKHCTTITDKLKVSHETVMINIDSSSNVEER